MGSNAPIAAYFGETETRLDDKGRLTVPRPIREVMNVYGHAVWYMARGFDQCVFLFHRDEWDNILEQVTRYASMNRKALEFRRLFFSSVSQVQLDGQGRMPVAANLRAIAGIQRDVALIGVGDHLELWDRETWRAYQEKKVAEYQEMASELFSGIDEAAPGAEDGKGLSDAD